MRTILTVFFAILFCFTVDAQMNNGSTILYGNEWIDYQKPYYKIKLAEDGIYRVSYSDLVQMGFPVSQASGTTLKLYSMGEEVSLYSSTTGPLGFNDYIEFIGKRNRGELDKYLYINGEQDQLNPEYSLFSDTSAYFLTLSPTTPNSRFVANPYGVSGNNQSYYLHEEVVYFDDKHHKPTYRGEDHIQYSHFDVAEGFGTKLSTGTSETISVANKVSVPGINAKATVRFGSDENTHAVQIRFNGALKITDSYSSFATKEFDIALGINELNPVNTIDLIGTSSADDNHTLASVKLLYPRQSIMTTDYFDFLVSPSNANTVFSFNVPGSSYVVYDEENNQRTAVNAFGGSITFGVSPGSKERKIRIYNASSPKAINNATRVNFINYTNYNPSYLILSGDKLYDPTNSNNAVKAYGDYRASFTGGNHSVYIASGEDIIDQFAYGIDRHNIGNRNFAFFVNQHWNNLNYWFNIGKGLEYSAIRKADNNSATIQTKFVLPTYGAPGSDVMMLSEIDEALPLYSVGRLAASSQQEVVDYLEKMIVHDDKDRWMDTQEERYWMKRVLHMSGGRESDEQIIFFSLENMRSEIDGVKFGADVTTIRKFPDEVETASLSQISSDLINDGVSLITFFGHSAPGVFDLSLEDPSQYTNFEKYPFIVSLGCFSGNIHTTSFGISEDFVLEPRKSAIGFLASSGTAYLGAQANSGKKLYDFLGDQYYGQSMGNILKKLYENYQNDTSLELRTLMQQYALHGDPALKVNEYHQPDLTVDKNSVQVLPEVVDPTLSSFEIAADITNIGVASNGSIAVNVMHYAPDGSLVSTTPVQLNTPLNVETLIAEIPLVSGVDYIGKNTIDIQVDVNNSVGERSESNNTLRSQTNGEGFCFYILDNGITPVSPGEFSILTNTCPFEIKASTNNGVLDKQNYLIEIDTTELFNSPLLEQTQKLSSGGLISHTPSIAKIPNTVYYWRVSPAIVGNNQGPLWKTSSFIYLPGSNLGWNQSHYFQYLKDDLNTLVVDDNRQWQFAAEAKDLRFDLGLEPDNGRWLYVNGVPWGSLNPTNLGNLISVVVMDPQELIYFANGSHPYSELNTSGDYFGYTLSTSSSRKKFMDLMDNVPEGSRVFISTIMVDNNADWHTDQWDSDAGVYGYDIYDKLQENGITDIGLLRNLGNVPFVVAFEKGGAKIAEDYGTSINDNVEKTYPFFWRLTEGKASTVEIGPVDRWDHIVWSYSDKQSHDNIYLKVYGIDAAGNETLKFNNVTQTTLSLSSLNNSGTEKIRVEIHASDSFGSGLLDSDRSSPQLDFLRVLFNPLPELALVVDHPSFAYNGDVISINEQLNIQIPIENTSSTSIGITTIEMVVTDSAGNKTTQSATVGPLSGKSTELVNFSFDPQGVQGDYTWEIILNDAKNPEECYYFNNYASRNFQVTTAGSLYVSFEDFSVEKIQSKAMVKWSTASERNSSHFDVMRSSDGISFEKIGTVSASQVSNELLNYQLLDQKPLVGKNYYKVRAVDLDGSYQFTDIKSLDFSGDLLKFVIAPNPSKAQEINVYGNNVLDGLVFTLFDPMGRSISVVSYMDSGSNKVVLYPAGDLSSGNYYLQIKDQEKTYIKKVVIVQN